MATESSPELAKIANLLALLLTKDQPKSAAVSALSACGFTNKELAGLVGTTEGSIRAMLSQARRKTAEKPEKQDKSSVDG